MRKALIIVTVALVAVALAFGAGLLVQREYQVARIRAAEEFGRELVGLNDQVPLAPPWESWHYPNAKVAGSIQGASVRVNGELARPAGHYAVFMTADPFETVTKFYAEKAGFDQADEISKSRSAVSSHGTLQGESSHLLDDFYDDANQDEPRPVQAKYVIRRCRSYDLTVVITRADQEKHTHIGVLYDPHTEFSEATR